MYTFDYQRPANAAAAAAATVSASIASTTRSRVRSPNNGASRVLAAPSRLTAMIRPTPVLMVSILPAPLV